MSELVDKASLELARALYFQYFSIDKIHEETGVPKKELRLQIYGERGHLSPSVGSWYYERSMDNTQEFVELAQRNKLLAHKFTALAIQEAYESLKILSKKLDKKGNKVAFSPFDMEKLFGIITQLDKMQRLSANLPTDIFHLDMPKGSYSEGLEDDSDVLDMKVLAETIASDKGLMKLIQGANDEKGTQGESGDSGELSTVGNDKGGAGNGGNGSAATSGGGAEPESGSQSIISRGGARRSNEQGGLAESPDPGTRAGTGSSEETGKGTAGDDPAAQRGANASDRFGGDPEVSDDKPPKRINPGAENGSGPQAKHQLYDEPSPDPSDSQSSNPETRGSGDGKGRSKDLGGRPRSETSERRRSKEITEAELSGDWSDGLADEYEPI